MLKFLYVAVFSIALCNTSYAEELDLDAISEMEEVTSEEEFSNEEVEVVEIEESPEETTTVTVEESEEVITEVIESEEEMTPELQAIIDGANEAPVEEKTFANSQVTEEITIQPVAKKAIEKAKAKKTTAKKAKKNPIPEAEYIPSKSLIQEASLADYGIPSGFYSFNNDCAMRDKASLSGQIVGVIRKGKRLWVDDKGAGWVTVYRTSGPAYVDQECL